MGRLQDEQPVVGCLPCAWISQLFRSNLLLDQKGGRAQDTGGRQDGTGFQAGQGRLTFHDLGWWVKVKLNTPGKVPIMADISWLDGNVF